MKKRKAKNYFINILFTLLFSVGAFLVFKQFLPKRLFPETTIQGANIVIDSLALAAMNEIDTISLDIGTGHTIKDTLKSSSTVDTTLYNFPMSENMEGYAYIVRFFEKLYKLEQSRVSGDKIRIAYFSDSMTDGDLIVQDIRRQFQDKYGGEGVGFVGITSQSAQSRFSVTHKYSANWVTKSFLKKSGNAPLGVDGQVSYAPGGVYTFDVRSNSIQHCERLNNPTLIFGKSGNDKAYVKITIDKDSTVTKNLSASNRVNTLQLANRNPKRIKLEFHKSDSIPFYGVNFDDDRGVHVDNFSMRGNSGLPLSLFNVSLMQSFDEYLHYDLIILQYGTNVLHHSTKNYDWYEKKMHAVVEHLRTCFPNADFLIVSVGDKGYKEDMEMKTDSAVYPLLKSQRNYARSSGSSFINLFNLMGGEGSMVKWVEGPPVLANKDYTHFNASGARKIAELIYNEIEKGYSNYKSMKGLDE